MKDYIIKGTTKRFSGNGRKLGWPTANISSATKKDDGVYFGYASIGNYQNHPAVIFIGTPTTVGDKDRRVEAYLLDIEDVDLYDLELSLDLRHFYRSSKTFDSIDKLRQAIDADEQAARLWFKHQ